MPFPITWGYGSAGDGTQSALASTWGFGSPGTPVVGTFAVSSAQLLSAFSVRMRFSAPPQRFNPLSSEDVSNTSVWTVTGPGAATLEVVIAVAEDADAVDLFFAQPLSAGTWTFEVASSVKAVDSRPIDEPLFATLLISEAGKALQIAPDLPDERVLRKHLNPALVGKGWNAIIEAIDGMDRAIWTDARAGRDQMFICSASGDWLTQRAGERGLERPDRVGLTDESFRNLALSLTNRRLTYNAVHDLLEILYSPDAVRAYVDSALEPYELQDGDQLLLRLGERRDVVCTFASTDSASIARATAQEVAAVLNRAFVTARSNSYAGVQLDAATNKNFVRIYGDARGLPSSVRVTGGRAQVGLKFSDVLFPLAGAPFGTWDMDPSPDNPGYTRFQLSGTTSFDFSQLRQGDIALVYGEEFSSTVRGTYEITAIYRAYSGATLVQWFEVLGSFSQDAVVQNTWKSLVFHRPTLRTLHSSPRKAYGTQADQNGLTVVMPTTSPAVARGRGKAGYVRSATALTVSSVSRDAVGVVTITTTAGHGLAAGRQVLLEGVAFGTAPAVIAGVASGTLGASFL